MTINSMIHVFGEVLFDHFPDGSCVLGGAPFNVAWHLQAFGESPRFISRIGDDPSGHEIAALMDAWGMSREVLQIDPDHPTGSVRVFIEGGEPHYDIVADSAYDYIAAESLEKEKTEGVLYHGSLAVRNPVSQKALQAVKARHEGKIFIDVNLRPPWWERESLQRMLCQADWVKLNEAELAELSSQYTDLECAVRAFYEQFDLEVLIVTCGSKGAVGWDGRQYVSIAPLKNITVVDTVGAGDAFAALLLLGMRKQWPLETTLERAQSFASALVGRRGATVADIDFYRAFTERWL